MWPECNHCNELSDEQDDNKKHLPSGQLDWLSPRLAASRIAYIGTYSGTHLPFSYLETHNTDP